ncbi:MAG TPA: ribosome-associated translation inhibitor RaiA [Polyangiaceae bacterium]|nr:ribosome-associated translation inhibitor RaiA [Polyangiaceae bacterium]
MNIAITFRHMVATDAVKDYSTEKVGKMQRFLRAPLKAQVTLSCQHDRLHRVEVDIHAGPDHFHAHETSEDMYASIDKVIDKIERQIASAKGSVTAKKKGAERASQRLPVGRPADD